MIFVDKEVTRLSSNSVLGLVASLSWGFRLGCKLVFGFEVWLQGCLGVSGLVASLSWGFRFGCKLVLGFQAWLQACLGVNPWGMR